MQKILQVRTYIKRHCFLFVINFVYYTYIASYNPF